MKRLVLIGALVAAAPISALTLVARDFSPAIAARQTPPSGEAIYTSRCATCHDAPDASRAPSRESLKARPVAAIVAALSPLGVMGQQGAPLTIGEHQAVAAFLSAVPGAAAADPSVGRCASKAPPLEDPLGPSWNGWGNEPSNGRFQTAAGAGLDADAVSKLQLKWAFAFPGVTTASAQPTIIGNRVFVGSEGGGVYALDLKTGCTYWKFDSDAGIRNAIAVAPIGGRPARYALFFGDLRANVYAVDAESGARIWKVRVDEHPFARITGTPSVSGTRVFVPVSSFEEGPAARAGYPCCTFRGSMLALDTATGKQIWRTYMISEAPAIVGKNAAGTPLWKPAGIALWSSPTIDTDKRLVYTGTGNSYTQPAPPLSDAVIALDMETGAVKWSNQITPNDAFVVGCNAGNENCPKEVGPDHDFGNSPILRSLPGGRRVLLAGQKSGVMFALDPDNGGKVIWQFRAGKGGVLGGIEWGPAADASTVYIAVSDVFVQPTAGEPPAPAGGLVAVRIADGQRVWHAPAPPLTCKGGPGCSGAQSAAISVMPGVVFSGSVDGHIRGYSTADGTILWDFDTMRDFDTVNGMKGAGGSMDGAGPAIANGFVLTNSGYGRWRGKPGNVLLAFGK